MRAPARTLAEAERSHIVEVLQDSNWVVGGRNGAAAKLGLPRTTLLSRMQKLDIVRRTDPHAMVPIESLWAVTSRARTASAS